MLAVQLVHPELVWVFASVALDESTTLMVALLVIFLKTTDLAKLE
jgi:hypothetical protein